MRTLLHAGTQSVFAVALLFASPLAAQATWTVPDGASLAPVIALAAPGDILQLLGTHPDFTLHKGLTIRGPALIRGDGSTLSVQTDVSIPVGQQAHLTDITFGLTPFGPLVLGHPVTVAGNASFEGCWFECTDSTSFALAINSGNVVLNRCDIHASSGTPLLITGGYCSITQSLLRGQLLGPNVPEADPAIQQDGGVLVLSKVKAIGGGGSTSSLANVYPAPALVVTAGETYVSDSELIGGPAVGAAFGPAAAVTASVSVEFARTVLAGAASTGVVAAPAMVGFESSGPPRLGVQFTATATVGASPQLLVIVGTLSFGVATPPLVVEPVLGGATALIPIVTALLPVGPQVAAQINVPNVMSLAGSGVWLQAIQLSGAGIRASTIVGGIMH